MDERKISICVTTWQRFETTLQSFADVVNDERVSEIVIVDDCSDIEIYNKLKMAADANSKIKLYRNPENLDCYKNKKEAVSKSSNEWCIIFDSDNILTKDYLDIIFEIKEWDVNTIYQPSWAQPIFDFRAYEGMTFTKHNVAEYLDKPFFSTMLNAMNYFVSRSKYLCVWQYGINPHTADTILQNLNHLNATIGKIYVVPNMFYQHRIHDGSHYKKNNHLTGNLYQEIENKLRQLK